MRVRTREVVLFVLIGLGGVGGYLGVFVLLRGLGPQPASLLARLLVAFPTSWVNARVTFRSRVSAHRAYGAGLAGLALGACLSAVSLWLLQELDPGPARLAELAVLIGTQLAAAAVRFVLLRSVALTGASHPVHVARKAPAPTVI